MSYTPNIVGFVCQQVSAAADQAGSLRAQYPPCVKIIRVPCSGRVEIAHILAALFRGADGVFVGGCHFGGCLYKEGNYVADRRMSLAKEMLPQFDLDPKRLRWEHFSASEGKRFSEIMEEYAKQLCDLGPNSLKEEMAEKSDPKQIKITLERLSQETGHGRCFEQV